MRHGQVAYFDATGRPLRPRDAALTAAGITQAQAAAELLHTVRFDRAVCSGLPRTRHTASIVLGDRGLVLEDEPLLEEIHPGRLRDVPAARLERAIVHAYMDAPQADMRFIGGDLWVDFERRVLAGWRALLGRNDWTNLLVVAHDAVNRVLLAHVAGAGLHGVTAFEQDPACINLIEVDIDNGLQVRAHIRATNLVAYDTLRLGHHQTVLEMVFRDYRPDA